MAYDGLHLTPRRTSLGQRFETRPHRDLGPPAAVDRAPPPTGDPSAPTSVDSVTNTAKYRSTDLADRRKIRFEGRKRRRSRVLSPAFTTAIRNRQRSRFAGRRRSFGPRSVRLIAISRPPSPFRPPSISRCCWPSVRRYTRPAKTTWTCPSSRCSSRTREGPSSEEYTEAALPQPTPDPVEDVLDDPGTEQTLDAAHAGGCRAAAGQPPDVGGVALRRGLRRNSARVGIGASTTSESSDAMVAMTEAEPAPEEGSASPSRSC